MQPARAATKELVACLGWLRGGNLNDEITETVQDVGYLYNPLITPKDHRAV